MGIARLITVGRIRIQGAAGVELLPDEPKVRNIGRHRVGAPVAVNVNGVNLGIVLAGPASTVGMLSPVAGSGSAGPRGCKVSHNLVITAVVKAQVITACNIIRIADSAVCHQRTTAAGFPAGGTAARRATKAICPIERVTASVLMAKFVRPKTDGRRIYRAGRRRATHRYLCRVPFRRRSQCRCKLRPGWLSLSHPFPGRARHRSWPAQPCRANRAAPGQAWCSHCYR